MAASFVLKRYRTKTTDILFPTNAKIGSEIGRKASYVSVQLPNILDILEKDAAQMKKKGDSRLSDAIVIERMRRKSPFDRLFTYLLKLFEEDETLKRVPTYARMQSDAHIDRATIQSLWPQVKGAVKKLATENPEKYARLLGAVNSKENEREEDVKAIAKIVIQSFRDDPERLVFPEPRYITESDSTYKRAFIYTAMLAVAKEVLRMNNPKKDPAIIRAKKAAAVLGKEKEFLSGLVVEYIFAVLQSNPDQGFYPDRREMAKVIHVHFTTLKKYWPTIESLLKERVKTPKSKAMVVLSARVATLVPYNGRYKNKKGPADRPERTTLKPRKKVPKPEVKIEPLNSPPKTPQASAPVLAQAYEQPSRATHIADFAEVTIDQIETAMNWLNSQLRMNEAVRELVAENVRELMIADSTEMARFALDEILQMELPEEVALGLEALYSLLKFRDLTADFDRAMEKLSRTGQNIMQRLEQVSSNKLWKPRYHAYANAQYLGAA